MSKKPAKSNEMEERTGTDEEVAEIAGAVGLTREPSPPLAPYRGDREEDQPDREGPPPEVAATIAALPLTSEDINARMMKALESIEKRIGDTQGEGQNLLALAMMQLAEGLRGLKEAQLQGAQTIADMQRRTTRPENNFSPDISVFNPRGDREFPRPLLRCEYLLPWPVKPSAAEELTREEIELLNLATAGEHIVVRADRTKVKIRVRVITKLDSDEPSRVIFEHDTAFNNDYHRLMPHDWIRQMMENNPKTRSAAKAVITMDEEEALIAARKFNDGRQAEPHERVVSIGT